MLDHVVGIPQHVRRDPLLRSLSEWACAQRETEVCGVHIAQHSNDVAEIRLDDGRALMVKRGRYDWVAERFANSRAASRLMRERAGIIVPRPLEFPDELDDRPLEVYWRIDLPTLSELWEDLSGEEQEKALWSWGRLARRLHRVEMPGWGELAGGARFPSLERYLLADLGERLLPAVTGSWPSGIEIVEILIETAPEASERAEVRGPVLVHNDLHMGNVLCEVEEDGPRCVGLLDLEAAVAGPPEADLAIASALHGPHFAQHIGGPWFDRVLEGYADPLDPFLFRYYRMFHMANLGFFSAIVGDAEHAEIVADAARDEVGALVAG